MRPTISRTGHSFSTELLREFFRDRAGWVYREERATGDELVSFQNAITPVSARPRAELRPGHLSAAFLRQTRGSRGAQHVRRSA